jgi:hypothetical protein
MGKRKPQILKLSVREEICLFSLRTWNATTLNLFAILCNLHTNVTGFGILAKKKKN